MLRRVKYMTNQLERKLYSFKEIYKINYNAFRSFGILMKTRKNNIMSNQFMERIMLAVTEVNGCDVCSYAHTKMALETGMNSNEIMKLLSGVMDDVPKNEIQGILFGQHYADTRGNPSTETWNQINEVYGQNLALGILASIRVIMLGNAYGIPWSSFLKRFKGKSDIRSNLGYELAVLLESLIIVPISGIHALAAMILRIPYVKFKKLNRLI